MNEHRPGDRDGGADAAQVLGAVLLLVGAQGVVRQLVHPDRRWLLEWLPGGYAVSMAVYCVATLAGVLLAWWGRSRRRD
ncbi:hypothetical protein SAMN05660359_03486 [Geodermatophilus obscurus]|uniref:Uncharacterized protein n=1 Tax=Geodermatophilus obscurus TaxID=1861 RepID=A0A1I5H718_9ACTN|nr:hypothetical protein [Geodermatophilus obscurus]SFO43816.1 hypothetical protein SAMN05660359_03486 [Geodermatophilus obscurus]